jgi:hypothetical protein
MSFLRDRHRHPDRSSSGRAALILFAGARLVRRCLSRSQVPVSFAGACLVRRCSPRVRTTFACPSRQADLARSFTHEPILRAPSRPDVQKRAASTARTGPCSKIHARAGPGPEESCKICEVGGRSRVGQTALPMITAEIAEGRPDLSRPARRPSRFLGSSSPRQKFSTTAGAHEARSWSLTIATSTTSDHVAPNVGPQHRHNDGARTRTPIVCSRHRSPRIPPHAWLNSPMGNVCFRRMPTAADLGRMAVLGVRGSQRSGRRTSANPASRPVRRHFKIAATITEGRSDLGRRLEG